MKGMGRQPGAHSAGSRLRTSLLLCPSVCPPARLAPLQHRGAELGNHTPRWGGHSADPHGPFRSRLGNCLNVVWDTRPHHIDEQNKKNIFLPSLLELKWHIKTCHGFSLGHLVSSSLVPPARPTAAPSPAQARGRSSQV